MLNHVYSSENICFVTILKYSHHAFIHVIELLIFPFIILPRLSLTRVSKGIQLQKLKKCIEQLHTYDMKFNPQLAIFIQLRHVNYAIDTC